MVYSYVASTTRSTHHINLTEYRRKGGCRTGYDIIGCKLPVSIEDPIPNKLDMEEEPGKSWLNSKSDRTCPSYNSKYGIETTWGK